MWKLKRSQHDLAAALTLASLLAASCVVGTSGLAAAVAAAVAFVLATVAQMFERYFFFTAVVAPRMPGGFTT